MKPHEQRVVQEAADLREKSIKLNAFVSSETFMSLVQEDRSLLHDQFLAMRDYYHILQKRIARVSKEGEKK